MHCTHCIGAVPRLCISAGADWKIRCLINRDAAMPAGLLVPEVVGTALDAQSSSSAPPPGSVITMMREGLSGLLSDFSNGIILRSTSKLKNQDQLKNSDSIDSRSRVLSL